MAQSRFFEFAWAHACDASWPGAVAVDLVAAIEADEGVVDDVERDGVPHVHIRDFIAGDGGGETEHVSEDHALSSEDMHAADDDGASSSDNVFERLGAIFWCQVPPLIEKNALSLVSCC